MTPANMKTMTLRGISLFVAVAFTVTTLTGTPSQAFASTGAIDLAAQVKAQTQLQNDLYAMPAELGTIQKMYGVRSTAKSSRATPYASRRTVILIQDAHANPEGQQNVAGMLKYLETKYPGLAVGLEGAAGELHPEYLNLFSEYPEANRAVIEDLHQKGELNGAELFALNRAKSSSVRSTEYGAKISDSVRRTPYAVHGVEDPALYRDNLKTFRELLFKRGEMQSLLNPIRAQLEKESSTKLNGELRDFLKERSRRKEGKYDVTGTTSDPNLQAYVRYLQKQSLKLLEIDLKDPIEQLRFPSLLRVVKIEEAQKGFDAEKARSQWEEAVRILRSSATNPEEKEFVEAFAAYGVQNRLTTNDQRPTNNDKASRQSIVNGRQSGATSATLYPRKILEELFFFAKKHRLTFDGKEDFWKTWKMAVLQAEVDVTELLQEMNMLEDGLIEKLAKSEDEKALVQKLGNFDLLEKLLRLELSRPEYEKVLLGRTEIESLFRGPETEGASHKPQATSLKSYSAAAYHFYDVSLQRDRALVENTLALSTGTRLTGNHESRVPGPESRISVLYTGGFHTPGLEAILREKGIGYAVLTPRITKTDHGEMYQNVMSDANADLTAYFKVKNPFATKQEALIFKQLIETAAPALSEKYQLKSDQVAQNVAQAVSSSPVFSGSLTADQQKNNPSTVRFTPESNPEISTSGNSAVMAIPTTIGRAEARLLDPMAPQATAKSVAVTFGASAPAQVLRAEMRESEVRQDAKALKGVFLELLSKAKLNSKKLYDVDFNLMPGNAKTVFINATIGLWQTTLPTADGRILGGRGAIGMGQNLESLILKGIQWLNEMDYEFTMDYRQKNGEAGIAKGVFRKGSDGRYEYVSEADQLREKYRQLLEKAKLMGREFFPVNFNLKPEGAEKAFINAVYGVWKSLPAANGEIFNDGPTTIVTRRRDLEFLRLIGIRWRNDTDYELVMEYKQKTGEEGEVTAVFKFENSRYRYSVLSIKIKTPKGYDSRRQRFFILLREAKRSMGKFYPVNYDLKPEGGEKTFINAKIEYWQASLPTADGGTLGSVKSIRGTEQVLESLILKGIRWLNETDYEFTMDYRQKNGEAGIAKGVFRKEKDGRYEYVSEADQLREKYRQLLEKAKLMGREIFPVSFNLKPEGAEKTFINAVHGIWQKAMPVPSGGILNSSSPIGVGKGLDSFRLKGIRWLNDTDYEVVMEVVTEDKRSGTVIGKFQKKDGKEAIYQYRLIKSDIPISDIDNAKGKLNEYLQILFLRSHVPNLVWRQTANGTMLKDADGKYGKNTPDAIFKRLIIDVKWGRLPRNIVSTINQYYLASHNGQNKDKVDPVDAEHPIFILTLEDVPCCTETLTDHYYIVPVRKLFDPMADDVGVLRFKALLGIDWNRIDQKMLTAFQRAFNLLPLILSDESENAKTAERLGAILDLVATELMTKDPQTQSEQFLQLLDQLNNLIETDTQEIKKQQQAVAASAEPLAGNKSELTFARAEAREMSGKDKYLATVKLVFYKVLESNIRLLGVTTRAKGATGSDTYLQAREMVQTLRNEWLGDKAPQGGVPLSKELRKEISVRLDSALKQLEVPEANTLSGNAASASLTAAARILGDHYRNLMEGKRKQLRTRWKFISPERLGDPYRLRTGGYSQYKMGKDKDWSVAFWSQEYRPFEMLWETFRQIDHQLDSEYGYLAETQAALAQMEKVKGLIGRRSEGAEANLRANKEKILDLLDSIYGNLHSRWIADKELSQLAVQVAIDQVGQNSVSAYWTVGLAMMLLENRRQDIEAIIESLEQSKLYPRRNIVTKRNQELLKAAWDIFNAFRRDDFESFKKLKDAFVTRPEIAADLEPELKHLGKFMEMAEKDWNELRSATPRRPNTPERVNQLRERIRVYLEDGVIVKVRAAQEIDNFMRSYRSRFKKVRLRDMEKTEAEAKRQAFAESFSDFTNSSKYRNFLKDHGIPQGSPLELARRRRWLLKFYQAAFVAPRVTDPSTKERKDSREFFALTILDDMVHINRIEGILNSTIIIPPAKSDDPDSIVIRDTRDYLGQLLKQGRKTIESLQRGERIQLVEFLAQDLGVSSEKILVIAKTPAVRSEMRGKASDRSKAPTTDEERAAYQEGYSEDIGSPADFFEEPLPLAGAVRKRAVSPKKRTEKKETPGPVFVSAQGDFLAIHRSNGSPERRPNIVHPLGFEALASSLARTMGSGRVTRAEDGAIQLRVGRNTWNIPPYEIWKQSRQTKDPRAEISTTRYVQTIASRAENALQAFTEAAVKGSARSESRGIIPWLKLKFVPGFRESMEEKIKNFRRLIGPPKGDDLVLSYFMPDQEMWGSLGEVLILSALRNGDLKKAKRLVSEMLERFLDNKLAGPFYFERLRALAYWLFEKGLMNKRDGMLLEERILERQEALRKDDKSGKTQLIGRSELEPSPSVAGPSRSEARKASGKEEIFRVVQGSPEDMTVIGTPVLYEGNGGSPGTFNVRPLLFKESGEDEDAFLKRLQAEGAQKAGEQFEAGRRIIRSKLKTAEQFVKDEEAADERAKNDIRRRRGRAAKIQEELSLLAKDPSGDKSKIADLEEEQKNVQHQIDLALFRFKSQTTKIESLRALSDGQLKMRSGQATILSTQVQYSVEGEAIQKWLKDGPSEQKFLERRETITKALVEKNISFSTLFYQEAILPLRQKLTEMTKQSQIDAMSQMVACLQDVFSTLLQKENESGEVDELREEAALLDGDIILFLKNPPSIDEFKTRISPRFGPKIGMLVVRGGDGAQDDSATVINHLKVVLGGMSKSPALASMPAVEFDRFFERIRNQEKKKKGAVSEVIVSTGHKEDPIRKAKGGELVLNPSEKTRNEKTQDIRRQVFWMRAMRRFFQVHKPVFSKLKANSIPGELDSLRVVAHNLGGDRVGIALQRTEVMTPETALAVLRLVETLGDNLLREKLTDGTADVALIMGGENALAEMLAWKDSPSVRQLFTLMEKGVEEELTHPVLAGQDLRKRTFDLRLDKNPELFRIFQDKGIVTDPSRENGYEIYRKKAGRLLVVLQLAVYLSAMAKISGGDLARLQVILPTTRTPEDILYFKEVLLPVARELAFLYLRDKHPITEQEDEVILKQLVDDAMGRIEFGSMLETGEALRDYLEIFVRDPLLKVFNFGLNDAQMEEVLRENILDEINDFASKIKTVLGDFAAQPEAEAAQALAVAIERLAREAMNSSRADPSKDFLLRWDALVAEAGAKAPGLAKALESPRKELEKKLAENTAVREDQWTAAKVGRWTPEFLNLIDNVAAKFQEYNKGLPVSERKTLCFCGELAQKPHFALLQKHLERKYPDVPFSRSMSPSFLPENVFFDHLIRNLPPEKIPGVFSFYDQFTEKRAIELTDALLSIPKALMITIEEWQERYRKTGFYQAFYRTDIDPVQGIGSIKEFDFMKAVASLLSKLPPRPGRQTSLESLQLSEGGVMTPEDLSRVLDALQGILIMRPDERGDIEKAFRFLSQVRDEFNKKRKANPKKYDGRLHAGNLDDFLSSFESDDFSVLGPHPDEKGLQQRRQEFYSLYYRHANNVMNAFARLAHVTLEEVFPPQYEPAVLQETLQVEDGDIEILSRKKIKGWLYERDEGFVIKDMVELTVFAMSKLREASGKDPELLDRTVKDVLDQHPGYFQPGVTEVLKAHPKFLDMKVREALACEAISMLVLEKALKKHPDFIADIFHQTARPAMKEQTRISYRLQRTLTKAIQAMPHLDKMPVQNRRDTVLKVIRSFMEDADISYAVWRYHRFKAFDLLWNAWTATRNVFLDRIQRFAVHMQTLRSFDFMEKLYDNQNPMLSSVAFVFQNIRRSRVGRTDILALRMAMLADGMIRVRSKDVTEQVAPSRHSIQEFVEGLFGEMDLAESQKELPENSPLKIDVDLLKEKVVWLCYNHRILSMRELLTSDEITGAISGVLKHFWDDQTKKWRPDAQKLLGMLYLMAVSGRVGLTDPDKVTLRMQEGPDGTLARWQKFYLAASVMIAGNLPYKEDVVIEKGKTPEDDKKIGYEEAIRRSVQNAHEKIKAGYVSKESEEDLIERMMQRDVFEPVANDYLRHNVPDRDRGRIMDEFRALLKSPDDFKKAFDFYQQTVSPYAARPKKQNPEAFLRQILFFSHVKALNARKDYATVPVMVTPFSTRGQDIPCEILVGSGEKNSNLDFFFATALFKNRFLIEDVTEYSPEGGKGTVVRFLGFFVGENEEDLEKAEKDVHEDLAVIFNISSKTKDRDIARLRKMNANAKYKVMEVLRRPGTRMQLPNIGFSFDSEVKNANVLTILTPDRAGLYSLARGTFLQEIKGVKVVQKRFKDLDGGLPRMDFYLTDLKGRRLSSAKKTEIETKFTDWLSQDRVALRKGRISSARAEFRVSKNMLLSGAMGAISLELKRRSETRGTVQAEETVRFGHLYPGKPFPSWGDWKEAPVKMGQLPKPGQAAREFAALYDMNHRDGVVLAIGGRPLEYLPKSGKNAEQMFKTLADRIRQAGKGVQVTAGELTHGIASVREPAQGMISKLLGAKGVWTDKNVVYVTLGGRSEARVSASKKFVVSNKLGIHGRPAMLISLLAEEFEESLKITITRKKTTANAASPMGLLTLGAAKDSEVTVVAEGPKAAAEKFFKKLAALREDGSPILRSEMRDQEVQTIMQLPLVPGSYQSQRSIEAGNATEEILRRESLSREIGRYVFAKESSLRLEGFPRESLLDAKQRLEAYIRTFDRDRALKGISLLDPGSVRDEGNIVTGQKIAAPGEIPVTFALDLSQLRADTAFDGRSVDVTETWIDAQSIRHSFKYSIVVSGNDRIFKSNVDAILGKAKQSRVRSDEEKTFAKIREYKDQTVPGAEVLRGLAAFADELKILNLEELALRYKDVLARYREGEFLPTDPVSFVESDDFAGDIVPTILNAALIYFQMLESPDLRNRLVGEDFSVLQFSTKDMIVLWEVNRRLRDAGTAAAFRIAYQALTRNVESSAGQSKMLTEEKGARLSGGELARLMWLSILGHIYKSKITALMYASGKNPKQIEMVPVWLSAMEEAPGMLERTEEFYISRKAGRADLFFKGMEGYRRDEALPGTVQLTADEVVLLKKSVSWPVLLKELKEISDDIRPVREQIENKIQTAKDRDENMDAAAFEQYVRPRLNVLMPIIQAKLNPILMRLAGAKESVVPRAEVRLAKTAVYKATLSKTVATADLLSVAPEIIAASEQIGIYSAQDIAAELEGGVTEDNVRKARLWIAMKLLEAMSGQEGRIANEPLQQFLEKVMVLVPLQVSAASEKSLAGPQLHANLSGLSDQNWSDLIRDFPVVLAMLVTLRAHLSINIDADGEALEVIQKKFDNLIAQEGISLAPGQFQVVSALKGSPFESFKSGSKADALIARDAKAVSAYNRNVAARWLIKDAPEDKRKMESLAAGLATALLYAASDKKLDPLRVHTPSEYEAVLAAVISAISGYASILKAA